MYDVVHHNGHQIEGEQFAKGLAENQTHILEAGRTRGTHEGKEEVG